jgi:hypothetical protein
MKLYVCATQDSTKRQIGPYVILCVTLWETLLKGIDGYNTIPGIPGVWSTFKLTTRSYITEYWIDTNIYSQPDILIPNVIEFYRNNQIDLVLS